MPEEAMPPDDLYVVYRGRTMLRAIGSDDTEVEDTATDADATPDVGDTAEGAEQVENWEQRYKDLQAHATRESQRRAELEDRLNDPDRRQELLDEWGFELADDEEVEDTPGIEPDPYDPEYLYGELQSLKGQLAERQQAEQQFQQVQAQNEFISEQIDAVCEAEKADLDDDEKQMLGDLSIVMRDKRGRPDVQAAYERLYGEFVKSQRSKWAKTKKADRPGEGAAATEKVNLRDPNERRDFIARRLEEKRAQQ